MEEFIAQVASSLGPGGTVTLVHAPDATRRQDIEMRQEVQASSLTDLLTALGDPASVEDLRIEGRKPGETEPCIVAHFGVAKEARSPAGPDVASGVRVTGTDENWVHSTCDQLSTILEPAQFWRRKRRIWLESLATGTYMVTLVTWFGVFVLWVVQDEQRSKGWAVMGGIALAYSALLRLIDVYLTRTVLIIRPRRRERLLLALNSHHRATVWPTGLPMPSFMTILTLLGVIAAFGAWLLPRN
ncbi:hypothetical protein L0F81_22440 [Streptomyces tricolor]|uniref:Integral membrane protein n=1 Tax=Streptomyces tricolor TaxID=68277 RepID=A0ABS9JKC9_9ACTN|nr:hypothetical protein [Streptomyces tricolor]MCG0066022.1 hypothetical protein [Streptomyces tricolor]